MNLTEQNTSSEGEKTTDKYDRLSRLFAYGEELKVLENKKKKLLEKLGETYYYKREKEAAVIVCELEHIESEISEKLRKTEGLSDAL